MYFSPDLLDCSNNIEGPFIVAGAETILCSLFPLSCTYLKKNAFNIRGWNSVGHSFFLVLQSEWNIEFPNIEILWREKKKCDKIGCYMESLKITWKLQGEGVCRRVPCCDNGDPDRRITQCDSHRTTWTLWAGKEGRAVEFTTVDGNGL